MAFRLKKCSRCICAGADRKRKPLPDGGIVIEILQLTVLIGWTGDPKHYYNYVLKLENVQKYDTRFDVSCFTYEEGKTITRPPQNMYKCSFLPDFAAAKIRHIDFVITKNKKRSKLKMEAKKILNW